MNHPTDCHVTPSVKPVDERALRDARSARLAIDGIGCEHCAVRVQNALLALHAVLRADVDADSSEAIVAFDPLRTDVPGLLEAVAGAGNDGRHHYRARVLEVGGA
ncbi:MAG: heavy-metal-associated domain-containing protein [Trueperaceae bacterium]